MLSLVLVTEGAGVIGSHAAAHLVYGRYDVVMDDLSQAGRAESALNTRTEWPASAWAAEGAL